MSELDDLVYKPLKPMDLEELAKTKEFASLTRKQKLCIATYINNDYDIINAIRTAYDCKSDDVAKIMSYRFFRSFAVAMTLSRHFGESPKDAFLGQLARDILKGNIKAEKLKAYTLYANIEGWNKTAVVRAYEIAREMGYGPANAKKRDQGYTNLKNNIKAAIKTGKAAEPKKDENDFDLSGFEEKE